jgi:hypothetical protein
LEIFLRRPTERRALLDPVQCLEHRALRTGRSGIVSGWLRSAAVEDHQVPEALEVFPTGPPCRALLLEVGERALEPLRERLCIRATSRRLGGESLRFLDRPDTLQGLESRDLRFEVDSDGLAARDELMAIEDQELFARPEPIFVLVLRAEDRR